MSIEAEKMRDEELVDRALLTARIKGDLFAATMKHLRGRHDQKLHGNRGGVVSSGSLATPVSGSERGAIVQKVYDDIKAKMGASGRSWTPGRRKYAWAYLNWVTGGKIGATPDPKTFGEDVARAGNHIRRIAEGHPDIKKLGAKREPGTGPAAKPEPPKVEPKPKTEAPKPTPSPAAAVAKVEGKPAGTPVSSALYFDAKMPAKSKIRDSAVEAMGLIDSVHGDGTLKKIPIKITKSRSLLGVFHSYITGVAVDIALTGRDHPIMTALHEIGHFIDNGAMAEPTSGAKRWGLSATLSGRGFGPSGTPEFNQARHNLEKVLTNTPTIKHMDGMLSGKVPPSETFDVPTSKTGTAKVKVSVSVQMGRIHYLMDSKEIFARAYSQYIAVKTKNPKALAELHKEQAAKKENTPSGFFSKNHPSVWEDDEFAPVVTAFDNLFSTMGWIK